MTRRFVAPALFTSVLGVFLLAAQTAKADTIVFHDLGDTISFSFSGPVGRLSPFCPNTANTSFEECDVFLAPPSPGATPVSNLAQFTYIAEDASLVQASDYLLADAPPNPHGNPAYFLSFNSDSDSSPFVGCNVSIDGCKFLEDGTVHTLGTINWNDPNQTIDTVQYESDAVPEPASLVLLGTGLLSLSARVRKRLRHQ